PGVKINAELLDELKKGVSASDSILDRAFASVPRALGSPPAEHVGSGSAHGVPVHDGEAEVIAHGLALHELFGVVVLERQWVAAIWAFVLDRSNLRKEIHAWKRA